MTSIRTYIRNMQLAEHGPPCPRGHPYRPDQVVVGWDPCLCTPGHTGHRSYWCREDDVVQLVPACTRGELGTAAVLGWTAERASSGSMRCFRISFSATRSLMYSTA